MSFSTRQLAVGNAFIAIGAIMPGFGDMAAKVGSIEALYVTELVGLIVIWGGYSLCVRPSMAADALPRDNGQGRLDDDL